MWPNQYMDYGMYDITDIQYHTVSTKKKKTSTLRFFTCSFTLITLCLYFFLFVFLLILATVITQLNDKNVTLIILFRTRFFSFFGYCNL